MRHTSLSLLIAVSCVPALLAAEPAKLEFDVYSGYFVSNKFEPKAAESFVVLRDKAQFDKVFGAAVVMGDKSHRLPVDAFDKLIVAAVIKRGKESWEYKTDSVTVKDGVVEIKYTATSTKSDSATYASPLIVSIPKDAKDNYSAIHFIENDKVVKKIKMSK
jgi:hypothetical protein